MASLLSESVSVLSRFPKSLESPPKFQRELEQISEVQSSVLEMTY
jgi:hypothetical protein